jgi:glycosyltransferase involved in cell wall biosynthesis
MELNICNIPPTICLNMIVKNESHIIKNTLEKLCNKIKFSYWVICDTGSTDNTQQIIKDFFYDKNIPGELHNTEWINFAYNRNIALNEAHNKTDLLLVFDADDEIHGDIMMPQIVDSDGYFLYFGNSHGISYERILLVNNKIKWEFKSVIHEYINCLKPNPKLSFIEGNYYVESGRSGSRNNDPNKYLNDANILEEAYYEAKTNNDPLYMRYGFYCANSYKDAGKIEDSIKWYKITLCNNNWTQEKYISCLNLYNLFNILGEKEKGLYYLVESFHYDLERMECVFLLIKEYCCRGLNKIAYNYYCLIKDFYENKYLQTNNYCKLFIENDKSNFYLPYYMIIVADKVKDTFLEAQQTIIRMFEIIFTKKYLITDYFFIGNLLYNLQFFVHFCCQKENFIHLANEYLYFLYKNGVNLEKYDFLFKSEYKNAGINVDIFSITEVIEKNQKYSTEICKNSKNILIYTGFLDFQWNYTYMQNNALGGSEKAVAYLSKCFPKDYNIYISGHVKNEITDNIQFVHLDELTNLINSVPFHTVIVSRYISFYEMYKECSFYQSFIWAHDTSLFYYGCTINESQILKKWNKYINKCICLTEWHKNEFIEKYPILKNKITLINNGIDCSIFSNIITNKKIKNKFIYSSRPERGLNILLELWPQILKNLPDATLVISFYGTFPSEQLKFKTIIDSYDSIQYLGKLNSQQLYEEMASSEYWLYPTYFNETSCITALEMLMSGVICLYYPVAGLVNTVGNYGIQLEKGQEIEAINNLTVKRKTEIIKCGKEYALSCCWTKRSEEWKELIFGINIVNKINIKKYKLSACLLIKNETENLNDWLKHYINQGVEHFFITSNNSSDGIDIFIKNSKYNNMITLIIDNRDLNIYANSSYHSMILCDNFYNIITNSTEWCLLVDIDEFMYGKNGFTLSSFIDTLDENIGCFYVYWNIFKPTLDSEKNICEHFSLEKSTKRINLDLITKLSNEIQFASKFGKSIFRTSMTDDDTQLWIHKVPTSGKIINNYNTKTNYVYDNDDVFIWSEENYNKLNIVLNHYPIRNKSDYDKKITQLENNHRFNFIKGIVEIANLDNSFFIDDYSLCK